MPDAVVGSGAKKRESEGKRYGMDTGVCSNGSSFCGGCSRACLCGSVQDQSMPAGLKIPAIMPDRDR